MLPWEIATEIVIQKDEVMAKTIGCENVDHPLVKFRRKVNLSQKDLADTLDITRTSVGRMEGGDSHRMRASIIFRLYRLGMPAHAILSMIGKDLCRDGFEDGMDKCSGENADTL